MASRRCMHVGTGSYIHASRKDLFFPLSRRASGRLPLVMKSHQFLTPLGRLCPSGSSGSKSGRRLANTGGMIQPGANGGLAADKELPVSPRGRPFRLIGRPRHWCEDMYVPLAIVDRGQGAGGGVVGGALPACSLRASAACMVPGVTAWRWPAVDIDWPHLRHVVDSGEGRSGTPAVRCGKPAV